MSRMVRCAIGKVLKARRAGAARWEIQFTITDSNLSFELSAISYQLSASYSLLLGKNFYSLIHKCLIADG
jgi:hypothetical protein